MGSKEETHSMDTWMPGKDGQERGKHMIDFEAEINSYRPSLEVDAIEDAIVRSDLTDMNDLMMDLIKEINKE